MRCEELLKLLGDYVDGEIDPAFCAEFEKHIQECDPCKIVIDTVRKTITLYKDNEPFELPVEFRQRLHNLLRDKWKEIHQKR